MCCEKNASQSSLEVPLPKNPGGEKSIKDFSTSRRWFLYLIGFFESFLFGGAIFGWAQLVYVLKAEGLFLNLCDFGEQEEVFGEFGNYTAYSSPNTTLNHKDSEQLLRGCEEQDETFALIYTVACTVYSTPGFLLGYMLHHLGLAVTRISAGAMLVSGFVCMGMASKESPYWIYAAMVFIALGGNQLRMAGLQLANLFPKYRSTAITIMSGIYAASAGLFLFVQVMVQAGFTRQLACWILAGVASTSILLTLAMPSHHIPDEEDESKVDEEEKDEFKSTLSSFVTWLHFFWVFVNLYGIVLFATFFNSWISGFVESPEEAGFFSSMFSLGAFLTPVISPFPGLFMDYMAKRVPKDCSEVDRRVVELRSPMIPFMMVSTIATTLYSCLFFNNAAACYIAIVMITLARPSVLAVGNAFIRLWFPASHFNRLVGIYSTIASLLTIIQYPHFVWAQSNYLLANGLMMAVLILGWIHPLRLLSTSTLRTWATRNS